MLHTHFRGERASPLERFYNTSCILEGPWWKRFGVQLTKRKGPDMVRLSDVTELRVFKGQTELLDKCHRHHIDIGPVFLMLRLCLL